MGFWDSNLGSLSGTAEDAFTKQFRKIPDNTTATAQVAAFTNEEFDGKKHLRVDWVITGGDFKGQHVFQKIHAFDTDDKRRHKALNMLMLLYKMFDLKPASSEPPTNLELAVLVNKHSGIKIQETEPNDKGNTYNWVSEVHPVAGFKVETGLTIMVEHSPMIDSAFGRNPIGLENDIPF